jgi:hypothetical protein
VEAYGTTLDESATPGQVAFVLVRALADNVLAAQDHPPRHEDRKAALNLTFSIAAHGKLSEQVDALVEKAGARQTEDPAERRRRAMFRIVKYWAPVVAHYVRSIDKSFDEAAGKMEAAVSRNQRTAHVYYDVSHDPSQTDPAKQQKTTLDIQLARESVEGSSYWRVARVGYRGPGDVVRPVTASQPASTAGAPAAAE